MKDEYSDIEETLKKYRHEPGSRVKQSVLSRYAARTVARGKRSMWRRPVPLYAVAAQIVVALGLGFLAARWLPFPYPGPDPKRGAHSYIETRFESRGTQNAVEPDSLEWEAAQNDLI